MTMTWQDLIDELQERFPPEVLKTEIGTTEIIKGDPSVHENSRRIHPDRSLLDSRSGMPCLILVQTGGTW